MNESTETALHFRTMRGPGADPILNDLIVELQRFAALLKEHGTEVDVDSPKARAAWAGLEESAKRNILKSFSTYHRNCREMHASGVSLRDNLAFVGHSLQLANMFAKDDLSTLMTNDHMIEVYNLNDIQIFRSINFFDYCNYSLLDLLAREWMSLYERMSSVTESIFKEIHGTVAAKELRRFSTPAHVMKERDASPCGVFRTDFLYCCPLFSGPDQIAGYLLVLDVTELDLLSADEQKFTFLR
jgi:hypothetical protein